MNSGEKPKFVYRDETQEKVPITNIFCIGRNYFEHIEELHNQPEENPLVFLKPTSSLNTDETIIKLPDFSNNIHYETEIVLLIGRGGKNIKLEQAHTHVSGYGVGLDLTARDLQDIAKKKGLPWTLAKGFDYSACVSNFLEPNRIDLSHCFFEMKQNNIVRQHGNPNQMIFNIPFIISYLSTMFTLSAGDIIFTGTPKGVGQLHPDDRIEINLDGQVSKIFTVIQ